MATEQLTSAWQTENFYRTQLSSDITSSATDIFLDTVPVGSEGTLIINPDSAANREIIFYNSKTATKVTCPSAALGRGYDNTTATSHTAGTTVIMAPISDWFNSLRTLFTTTPQGWTGAGATPTAVVNNGNRSYNLSWADSILATRQPGMRNKYTRTATAPTQSTSLNGTSQYYSKSSPAGMTFTDDFVVSAWVKLSSYPSVAGSIITRYNATSGWEFQVDASGRVQLLGRNAGAANYSRVLTYQSLPLNKWVHVTAQLDMSAFTATTTTSYVMLDGVDVPCSVDRGGTNPTALIQAGNLEIGSENGGTTFFPGKVAQAAVYSAKVTQATIKAAMNQTLSGSETSLISAYSFSNSIVDLNTTNANNLTANGSAVATNLDTPFTQTVSGITAGTTNYSITTAISSDGLTETVQVPEGDTLPTTGGISAVSYSTQKVPYGFPSNREKWRVKALQKTLAQSSATTVNTWYNIASYGITLPIGDFMVGYQIAAQSNPTGGGAVEVKTTLSTANNSESDSEFTSYATINISVNSLGYGLQIFREKGMSMTSATFYYLNVNPGGGAASTFLRGDQQINVIYAEPAYL